MKKARLVQLFTLNAMLPIAAHAEPGQIYFDCDSMPGHFSRIQIEQPLGQQRVSGRIQSDMLYREGEWRPSGQIRLSQLDGTRWVGLKLEAGVQTKSVVREGKAVSVILMRKSGSAPPLEEQLGTISMGQPVSFSIETEGDQMRVHIADTEKVFVFDLNGQRKIELGCSTGDFKFIDILSR